MLLNSLIIVSCDIPGIIRINNFSGNDIVFRCYIQNAKDSVEVLELKVKAEKGNNQGDLIMGFGQLWTDAGIKSYLQKVDKAEIITQKDTLFLTDKREMYKFFRDRRKGLFKNMVKINVE